MFVLVVDYEHYFQTECSCLTPYPDPLVLVWQEHILGS
jgi:hypothetical protein